MTLEEYKIEHRHIYDTRLGILGVEKEPTAAQHNLAVTEADAHAAALKREEHKGFGGRLLEFRDSL